MSADGDPLVERALAGDVYAIAPDAERAARAPVRLGLIGAGGVAQAKWLPAIARLRTLWEPVELVAIAEPRAEQATKVASIYGCRAFADAEAMLAEVALDAALVLSPDALHVDHATACLERGLHVLVEKPLARSLTRAIDLCRLADARDRVLMTVANKRYAPPYRRAKALIDAGALRVLSSFTGKFTLGYDYVDLLEGGTIHLFDLALFLMGPVREVTAVGVKRFPVTNPAYPVDTVAAMLAFASGAVGSLTTSASALSFKPWERVEVVGEHAWLEVDDAYALTLHDDERGPSRSWRPVPPNTLLFDTELGGYTGLLDDFLQAIRGAAPPAATGWDGARALELLRGVQLSLAQRTWIRFPLDAAEADRRVAPTWPVEPG